MEGLGAGLRAVIAGAWLGIALLVLTVPGESIVGVEIKPLNSSIL